ncbi:hypothetical protein [Caballeronia sp. HLA56]
MTAIATIAATLAGCGGSHPDDNTPEEALDCSSTPQVSAVLGYPTFAVQASTSTIDTCSVIAHYDAGYAIVADEELDPWSAPDLMPSGETMYGIPAVDAPASEVAIGTVPASSASPEVAGTFSARRYVLAKSPVTTGTPIECTLVDRDAEGLNSQTDSCLASIRSQQSSSTFDLLTSVKATGVPEEVSQGSATPDPTAWTLLGASSQQISQDVAWKDGWTAEERTGNVTLTLFVYRLNSTNQNDYYLVKANWGRTPATATDGFWRIGTPWGYYNNSHQLRFSLQVKRPGSTLTGLVETSAPQTVSRNKTYSTKLGTNLSFGEKGFAAGVSNEVAVSYSAPGMTISSSVVGNSVLFDAFHATSGKEVYDNDPTIRGGVTTTVWGLFSVPASSTPQDDDVVVNIEQMSGTFGWRGQQIISPDIAFLAPYVVKPYTVSFSTPHFSVQLLDENGTPRTVPISPAAPLQMRSGQSSTLAVSSVNNGTPVRLSWQITSLPAWLTSSTPQGAVSNGDGRIYLTANAGAAVGALDYVRINTAPRGAAASVRGGDIAIPVRIVP